jgi:hypothetical protein
MAVQSVEEIPHKKIIGIYKVRWVISPRTSFLTAQAMSGPHFACRFVFVKVDPPENEG